MKTEAKRTLPANEVNPIEVKGEDKSNRSLSTFSLLLSLPSASVEKRESKKGARTRRLGESGLKRMEDRPI